MPEISATFRNNYGESRRWVILDTGRDPNSPPTVFNDYLGPGDVTGAITLYSDDGIYAKVLYQRSDGAPTVVDDVTDGSQVSMD